MVDLEIHPYPCLSQLGEVICTIISHGVGPVKDKDIPAAAKIIYFQALSRLH